MTIACIEPFLKDSDPEVRKAGIRAIIGSEDPLADELLATFLNDENDSVSEIARNALIHRQPWLLLEPFPVRFVPDEIITDSKGKSWYHLRKGIKRFINSKSLKIDMQDFIKWESVPGAIPDIVEALASIGKTELAVELEKHTDLYGRQHSPRQQILLAPTYRCNLSCDYCYAKGWESKIPDEMTPDAMDKAFSWMVSQGINYLILCGGEPTVYTQFGALLKKARENGIPIMLTTNGLYSKSVRELIKNNYISDYIGHYEQQIMMKNSSRRCQFIENLSSAKENGMKVFLRYTLTEKSSPDEWSDVITVANKLDVQVISYGFAFKNIAGNNNYYNYRLGSTDATFRKNFIEFMDDCHSNSIKLHQSKPFPLCLLDKDTLRKAILSGAIRSSCTAHIRHFSHNVTINPDLTTFPCNGLGIFGPLITEFKEMADVGRYYARQLKKLQNQPFDQQCVKCVWFYRGFCQGVCLAQHYNRVNDGTGNATGY